MLLRKFLLNILLPFLFTVAGLHAVMAQATKEEFKPSGKIWGYAFGDYYIKTGGDTATWASRAEYSAVPKDVNAFALRRMYLGYDYNISPTFSTLVLLEAQDVFQDTRGDRTVTIKSLFLKWKNIYKRADLMIGQMPTLSYAFLSEKIWNYRSIEKMIIDQRAVRTSSDMGVALIGVLDSVGTYGYNVMISNGTGTRQEELTQAGKGKIFATELFGYFLNRKILLELYGDYQTGINEKNQLLLKSLLAYQGKSLTIGAEVMQETLYHNKSDGTDAVPFGFSVFARGSIVKDKLGAFARYDTYNQDLNYRTQDVPTVYNRATMFTHYDEQFFVAGLDFTPHKNVHLMPNIWVNSYTAKGTSNLLVDRQADIVPRLTFRFDYR
jgi:hypothetical protein